MVMVVCGKNMAKLYRYIKLGYYLDNSGNVNEKDIDGNDMICDHGVNVFYLPRTAQGREIRWRLSYTSDNNNFGPEVLLLRTYGVPISQKVRSFNITIHLRPGTHPPGVEQRPTLDQLNDLEALTESKTVVDLKGPWGNVVGWVRRLRVLEVRQEAGAPPEFLVGATLQVRKEA